MSKLKPKVKPWVERPDTQEMVDEQEEMAPDLIQLVYSQLTEYLERNPTMDEVMIELARRLAGAVQNETQADIDDFLKAQNKPRAILKIAQIAADEIWAKDPKKSKRNVAKILNKRELGSIEYLRKNLAKPPVT